MTDRENERLDRILSQEIRAEYGREDVPREAMWKAIDYARGSRRRLARRGAWAAVLAAAVVAGFLLIGRETVRPPDGLAPVATSPIREDLLLRNHLARTGNFLASVEESLPDAAPEARDLLARTRAMLDTDADPVARPLLEDAEVALVLHLRARKAHAPGAREAMLASLSETGVAERLRDVAGTGGP
jgi:hypothetical protein